jgi:hypothetical protein
MTFENQIWELVWLILFKEYINPKLFAVLEASKRGCIESKRGCFASRAGYTASRKGWTVRRKNCTLANT